MRAGGGRPSATSTISPQVFVDYLLFGRLTRDRTRVQATLRTGIRDGDTVLVVGNDVPAARAPVVRAVVGDPRVVL